VPPPAPSPRGPRPLPRPAAALALLLAACGGGGSTATDPLLCGGLVTPVSKPTAAAVLSVSAPTAPRVLDAPGSTAPAFRAAATGGGAPGDLCPTLSGTGSSDGTPFTVSGTVTYEDKLFNRFGFTGGTAAVAARQVDVEVVRCSDGTVLGSGVTDAAGDYSVGASNPAESAAGVYVRALTRVTDATHSVAVQDTAAATYAIRSNGFDETTGSAFPRDLFAAESGIGAPFNILDVALRAVAYVDATIPLTAPLDPLTLVWEAETTDITGYFPSLKTIQILDQPNAAFPDTDGYDDIVIAHETGHYVADQLSKDDSPGGIHTVGDDTQDARLAWSEGWANYFGGAANGSPDYVDTYNPDQPFSGLFFSMEDGGPGIVGSTSELGIAKALWDGLDSPPFDDDPSGLGDAPVLSAVEDLAGTTDPVTFGGFWNRLRLDPARTTPELDDFMSAALGNGIDLAADAGGADPSGNDAVGGAATLAVNSPSSANLAYRVDDPKSEDVDYFKVTLTGGVPYTACTYLLSDGADTAIEVLQGDGSPLGLANDNWDGTAYSPVCGIGTPCPPNDATRLASSLDFTPATDGDYLVRVTRAAAAPPSADRFGGYAVLVAVP
jgi:hypothetical protein